MRYVYTLMLGIFAAGCCNRNTEFMTRFHEDGRAKPVATIASMIDTTPFDASWSLSEEFTSTITQRIAAAGQIFIVSKEDDAFVENPFGNDLSWVKREFSEQEFVAFLELVEHKLSPADKLKKNLPPHELSTNLDMAVRLRVVDLRETTPKIILQEMVRSSYFIPKTLLPTDYSVVVWGTDGFHKTPLGIAHTQLVQEITARISDYILLAKSR